MEECKRISLLPGVTLNYVASDQFKTDYLSISLLRPLKREEAGLNSLLPEVLLQGCAQYPDMQSVAHRLDDLYGAGAGTMSRRWGEVQLVGLYGDCVSDRWTGGTPVLEPVIDMLGQLLLHPALENGAFCRDYVEAEKLNLIRAIQAQINNKRAYASRRMQEIMFADEAYGINKAGTEETVSAITPESLFAHYQYILAHSDLQLFYLGSASEERVTRAFRAALEGLPRGETDPVGTVVVRRAETVRQATETMDVAQGQLVMGLRTDCVGGEPGSAALLLCNAVLGGTVSSKLFLKVREEMSLCYSVGSGLDRTKGVMTISAGIAFENEEKARAAILQQLEDCKNGAITAEELENARSYLISTLKMCQDSPARQEELAISKAVGGAGTPYTVQIEQLREVTAEEVSAAARKLTLDTVYFLKGGDTDGAA